MVACSFPMSTPATPKSRFTIGFLIAFLVTAGVLQWFQQPAYSRELWVFIALIGALLLLLCFIRFCFAPLLLVMLIGSGTAFMRVAQTTHVTQPHSIEVFAVLREDGQKMKDLPEVTLHGFIVDEPDRRPMKTKYAVKVDALCHAEPDEARRDVILRRAQDDTAICADVEGEVLVTDHAFYPSHDYGDEVLVTGVIERPTQIEDFHYDRYLSRYGIYSVMYRGEVETLSKGHGHSFFTFLYGLKHRFESKLNRLYPEPHASFMAGLLTGSRRGIPEHLLEDFQSTGLTHIIAISGYNISIVIAVISGFLFFLPLKWRFLPALAAIAFFTLFVGASPSVVRAAIMGALGLFALQVGRQRHSFIAILLAAFLMVAWNPKILWYDAGFQLSFLSVIGLCYLAPLLDRVFAFVPQTFGLRESLQMTVAAQLAAVPLVVILFGQFSLVAPLANVLVAPLIPLAMFFGFLGTAAGFFSEFLGLFIAYPGWGALELIILITQFFAELPYAMLEVAKVPHWILGAYYAALLCTCQCFFFRKKALYTD
jgi:competence protein ComEC